ncbi:MULTISPECIES: oxepin-CoA hydrolase, alternative type [unclassified Caballeronia]|uniref:oxepin-CoA hydrolase, alternative type n=1 Tax=unclassified Caballeronia TaxID=2646786 RepID=UPI00285D369F|nr:MULTISPECIES: enoyl-CoA hydratase [unclassified Caballeronia]MDR5750968.1 enoyl-CoA hydratase [Caballeronia sp. LZ024]MDR5844897.1 enoyl-CoA hydratase [Caballeronia sp. LZ031]
MSAELLTDRPAGSDTTLVLKLSNPGAKNALHPDMYAAGIEALNTAERDTSVRAIVLTGADNFFCAGGNLNRLLENRAKDPSVQAESIDLLGEWISAIRASSKPVIAAVEGAAAGAGFSLALACDLIVSADDAKFVMSYARVGLTPDGGGSWFLTRALPRALASEILLEAKPIGAVRLHDVGVVNRLTRRGTALDSAVAWADDLGSMSPKALARIKSLIAAADVQPLAAHLDAERDSFVDALHHGDALEGISAFLEKRQPNYK